MSSKLEMVVLNGHNYGVWVEDMKQFQRVIAMEVNTKNCGSKSKGWPTKVCH